MREQLRSQLETPIIQLVIGVVVIGVGGIGLTLTGTTNFGLGVVLLLIAVGAGEWLLWRLDTGLPTWARITICVAALILAGLLVPGLEQRYRQLRDHGPSAPEIAKEVIKLLPKAPPQTATAAIPATPAPVSPSLDQPPVSLQTITKVVGTSPGVPTYTKHRSTEATIDFTTTPADSQDTYIFIPSVPPSSKIKFVVWDFGDDSAPLFGSATETVQHYYIDDNPHHTVTLKGLPPEIAPPHRPRRAPAPDDDGMDVISSGTLIFPETGGGGIVAPFTSLQFSVAYLYKDGIRVPNGYLFSTTAVDKDTLVEWEFGDGQNLTSRAGTNTTHVFHKRLSYHSVRLSLVRPQPRPAK